MGSWSDRLRFLWEQEAAPPREAVLDPACRAGVEPAGIPRPLRRAARFALIGLVGTSLMSQVIGIRLVAPVDAKPHYESDDQHQSDQQDNSDQSSGQQGDHQGQGEQQDGNHQGGDNGGQGGGD